MSISISTIRLTSLSITAPLVFLVLFGCGREHDPFQDQSNARTEIVRTTFDTGDTTAIFSSETLFAAILVRELVDSVIMVAPANRFGDTQTVRPPFPPEVSMFIVSFYDTGPVVIRITTFRTGGDAVVMSYPVFVRSPLHQAALGGDLGQPQQLKTSPVADSADVLYWWSFGNGFTVATPKPETLVTVMRAADATSGNLWVTDRKGQCKSPETSFGFSFVDRLPPFIGFPFAVMRQDTILSADTLCFLRALIIDQGDGYVASATIDGRSFDTRSQQGYYSTMVTALDTARSVTVWAEDNHLNAITRRVWLKRDTAMVRNQSATIIVLIPATDSSITRNTSFMLSGIVDNAGTEPLDLHLALNGRTDSLARSVDGRQQLEWDWPLTLTAGRNIISLIALSPNGGDTAAVKTMVLTCQKSAPDSGKPVLVEILLDGTSLSQPFTPAQNPLMQVLAFDEASDIAAFSINGIIYKPRSLHHWDIPLSLSHLAGGNRLAISLADSAGNRRDTMLTIFYNHKPDIVRPPSPPMPLAVGTMYRDTILFADLDADPLTITKIGNTSSGPTVTTAGQLAWQPSTVDTGWNMVTLDCFDGLEHQLYSFRIKVAMTIPDTVRFATSQADFPAFLQAGKDTLTLTLKVTAGTGNPPFRFTSENQKTGVKTLLASGLFTYLPGLQDTGRQQFTIRVTDTLGFSDTIFPNVLVVPPIVPCSLSMAYQGPRLTDGALDLRGSNGPDTLRFNLNTHDNPALGSVNITVLHGAGTARWTTDTAGPVDVVIAQRVGRVGRDTVTVFATDRFGISDTSTVTLYFGGFSARLILNLSALGPSSPLSPVPVLVRLDTGSFDFSIAGQNTIGFTDIQDRPLPFQIESWDSAGGHAAIWVLLDTIPIGNPTQSMILTVPATYAAASQPSVVFATSNSYAAEWHMNENEGIVPDATAGNDGIVHNGDGSEMQPALIADGIVFDGTGRYIDVASATTLNPSSDFTISGWFMPAALFDATTAQTQVIFEKTLDSRTNVVVALAGNDWTAIQNADGALLFRVGSGTSTYNNTYNVVISINRTWEAGQWYHFAVIHRVANPSLDKVYINGVDNTAAIRLSSGTQPLTASFSANIRIGGGSAAGLGLTGTRYLAGTLDEVSFFSTARSASWIRFCYENQRQGSSLISSQRLW